MIHMTSQISRTNMRFTKNQMQEELSGFLNLFGLQLSALYGADADAWSTTDAVQRSPIWETVNEMYDYGIEGRRIPGSANSVRGRHTEVERLLHALNTLPMKLYLDGQENTPPRLAILAAQCAAARHVLEGGDRHTGYATDEFEAGSSDIGYLTLAEIALLANMDERSVRNAANPKLPNPLVTEAVGRRSLVRPAEARRWLEGRKGFVPTSAITENHVDRTPTFDLNLPLEVVEHVHREAKELGIPFETALKKRVLEAYERLVASEGER